MLLITEGSFSQNVMYISFCDAELSANICPLCQFWACLFVVVVFAFKIAQMLKAVFCGISDIANSSSN